MKICKIILGVVGTCAMLLCASQTDAHAGTAKREAPKKQDVPSPFVVSTLDNNWFLSFGAGGSLLWEPKSDLGADGITPSLDLTVGRWFSPWTAIRLGLQGYSHKFRSLDSRFGLEQEFVPNDNGKTYYVNGFKYTYVHADFLWDMTNTIHYTPDRVWRLIPYTHMGVMRVFRPQASHSYKRAYVIGAGLINSFHIAQRTNLFVDLRASFIDNTISCRVGSGSDIAMNAMVGVSVDLGKQVDFKSYTDSTTVRRPVYGRFKDNFFIQVGGGINLLFEEGFAKGMNMLVAPAYDISVGKWFTPDFGARLGYQGGSLKEWLMQPRPELTTQTAQVNGMKAYQLNVNYDYFHADVLWDLTNLIYPYKYKRVWSFIPYYHTGFYNVKTSQGKLYWDGLAAGFGFYNTFNIASELGLYLDLRATVLNGIMLGRGRSFAYKGSIMAGLVYNIGGAGNWVSAEQYRKGGYSSLDKPKRVTGPAPYLDNKIWENLFVSVSGGVSAVMEIADIKTMGAAPAIEFNLGKWFSPQFAMRLGVQGLSMVAFLRDPRLGFAEVPIQRGDQIRYRFENRYFFVHADFLWNLNNTFSPYDYNRFWNIIPYYQFGVMQGFRTSGTPYKQEYSLGYGLINTFRLSDRLNLFLDVKGNYIRHRMLRSTTNNGLMFTALAGISCDVGKKNYWVSYKDAPKKYTPTIGAFVDNWFLSLSGGATLLEEGGQNGFTGDAGWTGDITIGKWLSPQFAGRIGFQVGSIKDWTISPRKGMSANPSNYMGRQMFANNYLFTYIHADILWNILNTIIGYDEYRVYEPIPYVHTGQISTYVGRSRRREYTTGVGILNNFNLSPKWVAFADLRLFSLKGESVGKIEDKAFGATLTGGFSYNIGASGFRSAKSLNIFDRVGIVAPEKLARLQAKVRQKRPVLLANGVFDNIFASVSVGANLLNEVKGSSQTGVGLGLDFNFGKWYSPYVGNRLGLMVGSLNQKTTQFRQSWLTKGPDEFGQYNYSSRYYYVHADFMWDLINTFWGYKQHRVWNLIPYTHFGYAQDFYSNLKSFRMEFAYGVGLLNNLTIVDRLKAFVDVRATTTSGRFVRQEGIYPVITTISGGLTYEFNKNYWRSYTEAAEGDFVLNGAKDSWFIGLSGGVTMAAEGGQTIGANTAPTGNAEFTFGRWFSPEFGGRIGYQTGSLSEWLDSPRAGASTVTDVVSNNQMCKTVLSFGYLHADLMWDVFNTFMGPNPERKWDLIPYAHSGMIACNKVSYERYSNGLTAGVGLFANYHLDEEFGLFADGRLFCLKGNTLGKQDGYAFASTINLGVSYNFGGKNWKKASEFKPDGEKEHFEKEYRSFALATNLLSWVNLGTINLEAQYEIARHWTLEGKIKYNPWTLNKGVAGQFQEVQRGFAMGARWWPWYAFAGWWIGADAQFKNYRTGGVPWFKTPEEGNALGASLGFGYSVLITKWFNLDFGISGWAGHKFFTNYEDSRFLTPTSKGNKWFVAPNELSVSAVFIF
ncbi:MAG: DUF3575 domain-containing protein [Bacteroidales bacterium]|nr:DUF3575 domain-containing protein [Bacteroidales bacterium]